MRSRVTSRRAAGTLAMVVQALGTVAVTPAKGGRDYKSDAPGIERTPRAAAPARLRAKPTMVDVAPGHGGP